MTVFNYFFVCSKYIHIILSHKHIFCVITSLPYAHFVTESANTCCTWHNERTCHGRRLYIFRIRRNDIDFYLHHQKDCTPGMCTCQIDNGNSGK